MQLNTAKTTGITTVQIGIDQYPSDIPFDKQSETKTPKFKILPNQITEIHKSKPGL